MIDMEEKGDAEACSTCVLQRKQEVTYAVMEENAARPEGRKAET